MIRKIALALTLSFASLPAAAATFPITSDVVGDVTHYEIKKGDTYYTIARKHDIGVASILITNPDLDPDVAGPGMDLTLPTQFILPAVPRKGIVINLAELRLYYFPTPNQVLTFPIGTGKDGWETLTGTTQVVRKRKDPIWVVPQSILAEDPTLPPQIGPGPDDPLGAYAMSLGWPNYAIHGTNVPDSVGTRASHGCIRLFPENIEQLFKAVPLKTPVTVIDKFYSLGWKGDDLYLLVYPTQEQTTAISQLEKPKVANIADLYAAVRWAAKGGLTVDWDAVNKAMFRHDAIPVVIATKGK